MQLSLPVSLPDDETFASFLALDNEFASAYLDEFCVSNHDNHDNSHSKNSSNHALSYIFGATGLGKSHLLFASCHKAKSQNLQTIYLNMHELKDMPSEVIAQVADYDLICLDNLHQIAGNSVWERTIFDLINQVLERTHRPKIVMSSTSSPLASQFELPDLVSRLTWGAVFQLAPRTDEQLSHIIQFRLEHRGLEVSDECIKFLLTRVDRELRNLMSIVNDLDKKSLQAKRKLTIPFIKQALGL